MKIEGLADSRCCGCAACANACAAEAIKMAENREGFLYPVINHELCVGCGACIKKCPYELDTPALLEKNYDDYKKVLAGEVEV